VLWRDLPEIDRSLDPDNNDALSKFSQSIQPAFRELLLKTIDFGDLRDPDTVRTQFNGVVTVTPTTASVASDGRHANVILDDPDPSNPFDPIDEISVGWIFKDANGVEFKVSSVHRLDSAGPLIELVGAVLPGTEATLGVGLADATVRPPALIGLLGADYGIEVDAHEPEAFQRSAVRNVAQWLSLKGADKSYDILGKISGYRVTASPLWAISSALASSGTIPLNRVYELPPGSGKLYTDLAQLRYVFDDVAADHMPADLLCWDTPDWATISPPPTPVPSAGTTVSEAIGSTMQTLPIISTTDLGSGRWSVRVGPGADLSPVVGVGHWYATFVGTPGTRHYLETVPAEPVAGEWTFEVLAGTAPVFGATVDIDYQCHNIITCNYCRASLIRVEVVPVEVLSDPDALLDGVLLRLVEKILQVVPAHVRFTNIIHVPDTAVAEWNITASASISAFVSATAGLGYYYDIFPADVLTVDPAHLVASGTAFTIP
jgi:hypothetical protein